MPEQQVAQSETKRTIITDVMFIDRCKQEIKEYIIDHLDKSDYEIPTFDIFVVWSCKTLQNFKALLSTTLFDGMYYECTYNGDKHELYLDAYKKFENKLIPIEWEIVDII